MSDDATVLWIGNGPEGRSQEDAARALTAWARTRGIRLLTVTETSASVPVDLAIGERVEREIDRAREAISAGDADVAERTLARAESVLRDHPELPQAAWLRAEVERTWATRWMRVEPRDEARAQSAWQSAQALDGGRVAGIGEPHFPSRPRLKVEIVVRGPRPPQLTLQLDGVSLEPTREIDPRNVVYELEASPAEHHVRATSEGRVLFASWIAIAGGEAAAVRIALSDGGSCGREQLAEAKIVDGHVQAAGITCPRWVAAMRGSRAGSVFVARCENDACGPLLEWRMERYGGTTPVVPQPRDATAAWPTWATWTLVGLGAATATAITLIATGAFESRPVEPRFVVGGARQE